jgi:thiol-disulfide isomerase/thioredoxin
MVRPTVAPVRNWMDGGMGSRRLACLALLALFVASPAAAFPFASTEPQPAPELSFFDADGNELSLADFRGKVVVLNLWATWCAPCRREMPGLDRLQAEHGGADLHVLPLSLDRGEIGQIREFYDEVGVQELEIYHDPTAAAGRVLRAPGLPTTLVIDREGREVGRVLGPAEWDSDEAVALLKAIMGETAETDVDETAG